MSRSNSSSTLADEFNRGLAASYDAATESLDDEGNAVTTVRSPWLNRICPSCGHTIRIGDRVSKLPTGHIVHDMPVLPCSGRHGRSPDEATAVSDFFAGLLETWPPQRKLCVRRLTPQDPSVKHLLAPPRAGFRRATCVVCAHTFRENDIVVVCPCMPERPSCAAAVHRDPIHGLHCMDAWNPAANQQGYCPVSSRKLEHSRPDDS